MAQGWEVIGMPKGSMGAAFKTPITEPLISGPHNDFSLPESFSAQLAALKGQMLLEHLAAELKTETTVNGASHEPKPAAEAVWVSAAPARNMSAPFVDMMMSEALLTRTENNAVTYAGSGNPLVDFFFQVVESSQKEDIDTLLDRAWEQAPMETLQLVAHLRDVRDGKGERERGWDAYIWLAQKHPRTLLVNLPEVVKVGFWKDLLQLLLRLCLGEHGWEAAAEQEAERKMSSGANRSERRAAKLKRLREWQASLKEAASTSHLVYASADSSQSRAGEEGDEAAAQQSEGSNKKHRRVGPHGRRQIVRRGLRVAVAHAAVKKGAQAAGHGDREGTKAKADNEEMIRMRQERAKHFAAKQRADMERAAEARHRKALEAKRRVHVKLEEDMGFRVLYAAVARTFADQLRQDLADLQAGRQVSSLCAKWAPTPKQAHDKQTLIATAIAELLYPSEQFLQPGMRACEYAELARRSYAKEYLKPLREAASVPETKMSQGKWGEVDYERVASLCMKINKRHFTKHDEERLKGYLRQVAKGEKKIASGALKPHELVEEAMRRARGPDTRSFLRDPMDSDEDASESEATDATEEPKLEEQVMEAQWKSLVDGLRQSGQLSSCLAVADVSGSMSGQPMNVAIALSLLTAAVAKPPFNQLICTFSARPQLHLVKGSILVEQVQDVSRMHWGMNTNVDAVFDLILKKAVATRLPPKDMVSTVFIFSDMEFDQATTKAGTTYSSPYLGCPSTLAGWPYSIRPSTLARWPRAEEPMEGEQTNFKSVKARYEAAGYRLPQVVFWNLAASGIFGQKSTPVQFNEQGVALVSGFSGQLLKLFMDKPGNMEAWKEDMSPEKVMMEAIKGKGRYDNWRVAD